MKSILFISFLIVLIICTGLVQSESKKLKKYVEKFEPKYRWTLNATYNVDNAQVFVLELVSQEWMSEHTNLPVWKHWLQICKPNNYSSTHNTGLLVVENEYNNPNWEVPNVEKLNLFGKMACATSNELTATILQVPNQFIIFDNDGVPRKEDDIVALTWRKYIDTNDATWVSLLPQTKSATQAMNAVQEFGATVTGNYNITKFVVTGASKRGWTAWGTAMSGDKRVVAIAPLVIPVLNLATTIEIQKQYYHNWSFALADYVNHDIPSFLYTKYFKKLTKIIDPIHYQGTLKKIPKYIIVATNDEFFPPDSTKFFYDQIKGEKRLSVYPNTNHVGIIKQSVITDISNFFKLVANSKQVPEIEWTTRFSSNNNIGTIRMKVVKGVATQVLLWTGTTLSSTKRDFRMFSCPLAECYQNVIWSSQVVPLSESNRYTFSLSKPSAGWTGFFYQVDFNGASFTTEVAVVPDVNPFPRCSVQECGSGKPSTPDTPQRQQQDDEDEDEYEEDNSN